MGIFYQPGRYQCVVTEQGFQESKNGKPMIVFKVRVAGVVTEIVGANGEVVQNVSLVNQEYTRTVRLVIVEDKPESLDYAMLKLRHAGFKGATLEELDMVGETIICECSAGEYQGQPSEDWNLPLPDQGGGPLQNDPNLARRMNAIFGRRLSVDQGAAPVAAPAAPAAASDSDEIPF